MQAVLSPRHKADPVLQLEPVGRTRQHNHEQRSANAVGSVEAPRFGPTRPLERWQPDIFADPVCLAEPRSFLGGRGGADHHSRRNFLARLELGHLALQFGGEILKDPQLLGPALNQRFQARHLALQFVIFAAKIDEASAGDSCRPARLHRPSPIPRV